MSSRIATCIALLFILLGSAALDCAASSTTAKSSTPSPDEFLTFVLPAPEGQEQRKYLGVPEGSETFRLQNVSTPYALVQIFSVYCPHCQAEAKDTEKLFKSLSAGPLGKRVTFFSVGAGNNAFEIELFREKYKLTIPLVTDEHFDFHKAACEPGTPAYYLARTHFNGQKPKLLWYEIGRFNEPEEFEAFIKTKIDEDK